MYNLKIYNQKNKQYITISNISYANSFKKRLFGLMGKTGFNGLIFKQKYTNKFHASIHTCFMKVPIDIIYINKNNRIQEVTTINPWKLYIPKNGYIKYIIELPENSIRKYNLKKGVEVVIEYEKKEN